MKYIRTKDGRIVACGTEEDSGYSKGYIRIQNKPKISATNDPIEILKEADSIEELCDEFVYYNVYEKGYTILGDYEEAYIHYGTVNETSFYGAIWTDKGLIYVAKLNEKGVLELL